jgi:hypothetical protein
MATSTNYGWSEPDDSSLVKDGAQAIRTLGDAIDTSLWNSGFGQAGKNKFINGNWGMNEGTDPLNTIVSGGCGVDDGSGNINRTLVIPAAATTLTYCWDACAASCSANLSNNAISNLVSICRRCHMVIHRGGGFGRIGEGGM